jgi:hypothetical protein
MQRAQLAVAEKLQDQGDHEPGEKQVFDRGVAVTHTSIIGSF